MLHQLDKWSTTHHPRWLVFLRVALGIALILKGIYFMNDSVSLESLLADSSLGFATTWLPVIITWLHLLGGFLIIIGLFTRLVAIVLIPVLVVAVFVINAPYGTYSQGNEFGYSMLVLLLLIFFFIEGSGPISLDDFLKKYQA